jgi:hypothetical protein
MTMGFYSEGPRCGPLHLARYARGRSLICGTHDQGGVPHITPPPGVGRPG